MKKVRVFFLLLVSVFSCLLCTCAPLGWNADLHEFIETGLSPVYLSSSSWRCANEPVVADARFGEEVTVFLKLNNPKSFDLTYTLSVDEALVLDTPVAPGATSGADNQVTTAFFTFTPSEAAEHGDVLFTLGLFSPSINRTFKPVDVTVHCDSPPDSVGNLVAGVTSENKACIGFTLPENYANADISAVTITYKNTSFGVQKTVTEKLSQTGEGLTSVPTPALLSSNAGKFVRYFCPPDVTPGNPYTFSITTIDERGKVCTSDPLTAGVTGTEVYLGYNSNGGTGSVAAQFGFNTTTVTISGASALTYPGFTFTGWSTEANASGSAYQPGDSFTFTNTNTMLFAQWRGEGDLPGGITGPEYQNFSITKDGTAITSATIVTNAPLLLSGSLTGTEYQWYVNGAKISDATNKDYTFTPSSVGITTAGYCTITATCKFNGVWYSANLVVEITE